MLLFPSGHLLLIFLPLSSSLTRQYHFVNMTMSWTEAQTYCRQHYKDLATVENTNDTNSLIAAVKGSYYGMAWIGLFDDVLNSWRWFLDDDTFYGVGERDYRNWRKTSNVLNNEPNNADGNEMCAEKMAGGLWNDLPCNRTLSFICYSKTSTTHIIITTPMTITNARQYCRQHYTDLASIRNATEDQQITSLAGGNSVFIGLYRTRIWSDLSNSTYQNWKSGQPDNANAVEHCTATSLNNFGQWTDEDCDLHLPFFCYDTPSYSSLKTVTRLQVKFNSWKNLNDSEIKNVVLQLQKQLISKGLPNTITLNLRRVLKKKSTTL